MIRLSLALVAVVVLGGSVQAGTWADGLFAELNKDFGTVARGPMLSHPFHLKNNTSQVVRIASVRVSCGCVTATALESTVQPGQESAILVTMDTRRFAGSKAVTIYVNFDLPQSEEVRLWVRANSRDDVTVVPDAFAFGNVKRGATPTLHVTVSFLGSSSWRIEGVQCESNYVRTSIQETKRDAVEVSYQLTAQLRADAPSGKWYTDVWLKTNNPATPRVRVPLTVEVESLLTVSPAVVDLGQVKVGSTTERKVIVRGVQPFRITEVQGGDDQLSVKETSGDSRMIHVLAVIFKPTAPGTLMKPLKIRTDLTTEGEIEFQARAQITP